MTVAYSQTAWTTEPLHRRSRNGGKLSLIIPMHNECAALGALFERLDTVLPPLGIAVEIVCVDDGSTDETLDVLAVRAAADPRVKVIALSRNFGKEAALTAGLEAATGGVLVPLDADLQDPPELMAEFLTLWEQGFDVVYGVRTDRSSDTRFKRRTAALFYRLFNAISDRPIPTSTGDFRLMDRSVVEALKKLPERNRFMKGLFSWVGFRQVGVPYARPARSAGGTSLATWFFGAPGAGRTHRLQHRSAQSLDRHRRLERVAALLYAVVLIVRVLVVGRDVPGYASLMVALLFAFAIQMTAFGVLGEYVGRLYEEVKGRPIYIVRQRIGFGS